MIKSKVIFGAVFGALAAGAYAWFSSGGNISQSLQYAAVGALLGALIFSFISLKTSMQGNYKNISANEVAEMLANDNIDNNIVLLDVRTAGEVSQGFIKGTEIFADIMGGEFPAKVKGLDKEKTYIVYCRSGNRSSSTCGFMDQQGFTKLYNLSGGISAWTGAIDRKK
jgi:rhodanese-related sulfurtransferase